MLVKYECEGRIGKIILDRPEKKNALNDVFVTEIKQAFRTAYADENCKVIVLCSSAEAFCAGADLAYLQQLQKNTFEENLADSGHLMELFQLIYKGPKVVIAQIEGPAIAGGCGLATVCDFSFSVPEASFGYTEVKIGFIPAIVMIFLIRKIGEGKARDLLLTGKIFQANEAQQLGLINYIYDKENIGVEVHKFAEKLCKEASADSIRLVKKMMAEVQHMQVDEALKYAAEQNAEARATKDCKKGISSFLNKEKISW